MGLLSILLYPFQLVFYLVVYKLVHYVFQILGFAVGLLLGIAAGYLMFIYKEPIDVPEPELRELVPDGTEVDPATLERYYSYLPPWVNMPDYERIDWLNKLVAEMWPYLGKAIAVQARDIATPILESSKPAFIDKLWFRELNLGSIPPTIIAIKTFDTKDEEVILQPVIRWATNFNILVGVEAKGIKGTVQIVDFTIKTTARITMKPLIPIFPCFSTITVSLMDKPQVDFGLKLFGLDVMALPGIYPYVQKTVGDVVGGMYLWPKILTVYDDQPLDPIGWLVVTHIKATNLRNVAGLLEKSDPYVRFSMDRHTLGRRMTTVKENELDPDWGNDELLIRVADLEKQKLSMEVFDKSFTGKADVRMSVGEVSLAAVNESGFTRFEVRLVDKFSDLTPEADAGAAGAKSKKDLGTLSFDVKLRKFTESETATSMARDDEVEVFPSWLKVGGGRLRIILVEGEELHGRNHSNPFVVLKFRAQEFQSKTYKKCPEVSFDDDPFELLLDEPPTTDSLFVKVYSKNTSSISSFVSTKESVGHMEVKLADVVTNGRIIDVFNLKDSKAGKIKVELQWHPRTADSVVVDEAKPVEPGK